jgi:hypothetical protein
MNAGAKALRLTLSDEGEGWLEGSPTFTGVVVGEAPDLLHGRFLKVEFDEPTRVTGRGLILGAWIKEHFAGQSVSDQQAVSVYTWLVPEHEGWGDPPAERPELWARCEVTPEEARQSDAH